MTVYVDSGIIAFYFWVHVILLLVIFGMWLYQLPPDEGEAGRKNIKPSDEDEGWPDW